MNYISVTVIGTILVVLFVMMESSSFISSVHAQPSTTQYKTWNVNTHTYVYLPVKPVVNRTTINHLNTCTNIGNMTKGMSDISREGAKDPLMSNSDFAAMFSIPANQKNLPNGQGWALCGLEK